MSVDDGIFSFSSILMAIIRFSNRMASSNEVDFKTATSIYDFSVKDTYGNDVLLEKYRGFVVLIVNIASQCGLTKSNYAKLTELHKNYYDKGNE